MINTRVMSHTQPPEYPFKGWGIKFSLSYHSLEFLEQRHHRLLLAESFSTTVNCPNLVSGLRVMAFWNLTRRYWLKATPLPRGSTLFIPVDVALARPKSSSSSDDEATRGGVTGKVPTGLSRLRAFDSLSVSYKSKTSWRSEVWIRRTSPHPKSMVEMRPPSDLTV